MSRAGPFDPVVRAVSRIRPLVGRRRGTILALSAASVGAGIAEAGVLAVVAQIASAMSARSDPPVVSLGPLELAASTPSLFAVAAVLSVARLLLQVVIARLPARLSGETQTELRADLFEAYLGAAWSEQAKEKEGHLQSAMGEQTSVAGNAVLYLANGLSAALAFLALAISALLLSVGVALAVMVTAAALFAALRPLSRRVRRLSAATSAASLAQASGVAESVRLAEEVQVFGAAAAEESRIGSLTRSVEHNFIRTAVAARIAPVLYQSAILFLLVAGLGLLYVMGSERLAALGAAVLLLVRASAYGQQFQTAYQGLGSSLPYLDMVTDAVARYRSSATPAGTKPFGPLETIAFEGVGFEYRSGTPVLHDINFVVKAGEAIGVVGPSGAGKSTIVQLLLRLRPPSSGSYLVNGMSAREVSDTDWRRSVAYLPQEPRLLTGTVIDNIRFHREWIDDAVVERAARLAHIHADICSWTDGYHTTIGQRAEAVSGGQRQRLCLARALAGEPAVLVLDEPTSALDLQSEQLIQTSLHELRGSLTLFVIAHRLTTLSHCDRIMVVREGHLEAFDSGLRLYDTNDFYREAVDLAMTGKPL